MSFTDSRSNMVSQHQYIPGSDAIGIWPHSSTNGNESEFDARPPYKRPRSGDDGNGESISSDQCSNARTPVVHGATVNRGTANIFFKTRLCAKFKAGTCRNGENCNFAHGMQDLRQPPHNWQELVNACGSSEEDRPAASWDDDQRIIHKMKLCKKFYNGEECPYGDRCNFLHEDPSKFREENARFRDTARESSAISIGTTGQPTGSSSFVGFDCGKPVSISAIPDPASANMKPIYWKTKLCTKWEMTGQCQFGDKCHFAHGAADLQASNGRSEIDVGNSNGTSSKQHPVLPTYPMKVGSVLITGEESIAKKRLMKLKDHHKLNRIYADWPDDLPFLQKPPNLLDN